MTNQEIKVQVMDLLNQIVVLTKDVKNDAPTYENYNYQEVSLTSSDLNDYTDEDLEDKGVSKEDIAKYRANPQELDDKVYLCSVRSYVKRVVDGDASSAALNETQYYTSTC